MKKIFLIPALMLGTMAIATEYNWEITPTIGANLPTENNSLIDDSLIYGGSLQYNGFDSKIKPEIQYLYTEADNFRSTTTSDISRIALNGVYNFDKIGAITPLLKAGIGSEDRSNSDGANAFFNLGAGAKIPYNDKLALKLETIYMIATGPTPDQENTLVLLAGLNYAFGEKAQPVAPITPVAPAPVDGDDDKDGVLNSVDKCPGSVPYTKVDASGCKLVDGDDDKDGVLNSVDKCPNTPAAKAVDATGCWIDGDDDKDGVLNSVDKCPNTPLGKLVYNDGCPESLNLNVNFDNDSAAIHPDSFERIKSYAKFLREHSGYSTDIVGYTSSTGSDKYNQKLSEQRAIAVQKMIIDEGVPASKVRAQGRGTSNPIASNDTEEGRAANRRIEAEITKD